MRFALVVLVAAATIPAPARPDGPAGEALTGAPLAATIPDLGPLREAGPRPPARGAGGLPRWGVALGAGFPEFATASLVFRPLAPVRLHAGPSWNYFGWGLQGGVTLVPWSLAVSPVLSLEAGRFFASDLSFVARGEDGAAMKPLLDDVSYSYAGAALGLEVGSPRGLQFAFRVGLSYVSIATHGTGTRAESDGSSVTLADPALNATLPSIELGVQYWF
jgi:hypothetical protein